MARSSKNSVVNWNLFTLQVIVMAAVVYTVDFNFLHNGALSVTLGLILPFVMLIFFWHIVQFFWKTGKRQFRTYAKFFGRTISTRVLLKYNFYLIIFNISGNLIKPYIQPSHDIFNWSFYGIIAAGHLTILYLIQQIINNKSPD